MCVPIGKTAGLMISPAAAILGAFDKKKKPATPTPTQAASYTTSGTAGPSPSYGY